MLKSRRHRRANEITRRRRCRRHRRHRRRTAVAGDVRRFLNRILGRVAPGGVKFPDRESARTIVRLPLVFRGATRHILPFIVLP